VSRKPGQPIKSLQRLAEIYETSVGRNANLLLGFHPDFSGAIPAASAARINEFGSWVKACYGTPLAILVGAPAKVKHEGEVTMAVSSSERVGRIVIQEDQTHGQRVRSFQVDVEVGGMWQTLVAAESIGHKRIIALNMSQFTGHALSLVRLTVLETVGTATIRSMAVYAEEGCTLPPALPTPPCQLVEDYEYVGVEIGTLSARSVAQCCSACRAKAHCVGFARTASGQCTLFKALGGGAVFTGSTSGSPAAGTVAIL
jgi:hypothetical protein